jgi:Zn-dependent alcohol dehydrogenase
MNRIRPFEVGTTVKWCDNGRECAGIIIEVSTGATHISEGEVVLSYVIRCPDLSEISKTHLELVVV